LRLLGFSILRLVVRLLGREANPIQPLTERGAAP
jgi:hypothetical protein